MITMVIDDRLKEVIQERLDSGAYRNFGALYRALRSEGLYVPSQTYFMIEVRHAGINLPNGSGKKKSERVPNGEGLVDSVDNGVRESELEQILECKKAALKRAKDLPMGYTDIAYFFEIDSRIVRHHILRYGKTASKRFEVGRIGHKKDLEHLYYKHASQVYERVAAGQTAEEIQQSTNISKQAYNYLLENKERIEPIIIHALRRMYNHPTHNVPYVTAELREHLQTTNN